MDRKLIAIPESTKRRRDLTEGVLSVLSREFLSELRETLGRFAKQEIRQTDGDGDEIIMIEMLWFQDSRRLFWRRG